MKDLCSTPNLLFLYTDEQRFDTLAAYGNTRIQMPNLNRLAETSTVFDQAYVTQPVCTPSRSSLLTGLYPHTNGCTHNNVPLRASFPCLPEMLRGRYAAAHFGKWHLGDEIYPQHGFTDFRSTEDAYAELYSEGRDRNDRSPYHHWLVDKGLLPQNGSLFDRAETARFPEKFSKPAFLAEKSIEFIREHRHEPFALYVNFLEPHMPFLSPRDYQYDLDDIPLPANFEDAPGADAPLKARAFSRQYCASSILGFPTRTPTEWRRMISHYWGLCSLVDTHAGRILAALEENQIMDNTLIVFTSDHGDMMGSHKLVAKCVMYEEAVRVPLLLRMPGQSRTARVAGPVSQLDLVPTLLELMNQPVPEHLQGQSLRPLLGSSRARSDRDVVIEWNGPDNDLLPPRVADAGFNELPEHLRDLATLPEMNAAVRDPVRTIISPDGWKFCCSPLGEHQLFNLNDDPCERRNLFADASLRPRVREMQKRLGEWQGRTGDSVALPEF